MADLPAGEVPKHLRDAHYRGAASLGHGEGYDYPHDDPRGWVDQQHRPTDLAARRYYEPSRHGHEEEIGRRMAARHPDEADGTAPATGRPEGPGPGTPASGRSGR